MRLGPPLLLAAFVLPLGGCCSMARFFCGPDRTDWVSQRYETPRDAVRTLLEALRRDDPEVVYESVSRAYRERLQLDRATLVVAWPRVRDENPGLHVAGYADVPEPKVQSRDRAVFELDVEGYRLEVVVVRQASRGVRFTYSDGKPGDQSSPVRTGDEPVKVLIDASTEAAAVHVAPLPVTMPYDRHGNDEIHTDSVTFAGYWVEWKVDDVRRIDQP